MRALLYADWCAVRRSLRQYLAVCCLMCVILSAGGAFDEGTALAAATYVQQTLVVVTAMMITMMCFFSLFAADERAGWEAARLALPVSRRAVVRARYAFLLALVLAMTMASALVGTVAGAVVAGVAYGRPVVPLDPETPLVMCACMLALVLFSSVEMPIFFWKGITKARVAFSLPLLLVPLLSVSGVQEWVAGLNLGLGTVVAWGMPVAALALLGSLRLSQSLYATRDF